MASNMVKKMLLGGLAAAGAAVWAIAPRRSSDKHRHAVQPVPDVWYAHRGLHDAGSGLNEQYAAESGEYVALARRMAMKAGYGTPEVTGPIAPENSLASFAAACEAGFGIELDIQMTADGRIVVVHDNDLMRVAGDPRRIADLTYDELTRIPLFPSPSKPGDARSAQAGDGEPAQVPQGYYQHVPLFSDVLKVVNGRVPIIVEYKFETNRYWDERDEEFMDLGDALLSAYDGTYVMESFHPGAVAWYRKHRPDVCRGQLAEASSFGNGVLPWAAGSLGFNFLGRPDFVAYDWHGGNLPQVRAARAMGATAVSWTVRSSDEYAICDDWFDRHIFESFVPQYR